MTRNNLRLRKKNQHGSRTNTERNKDRHTLTNVPLRQRPPNPPVSDDSPPSSTSTLHPPPFHLLTALPPGRPPPARVAFLVLPRGRGRGRGCDSKCGSWCGEIGGDVCFGEAGRW